MIKVEDSVVEEPIVKNLSSIEESPVVTTEDKEVAVAVEESVTAGTSVVGVVGASVSPGAK